MENTPQQIQSEKTFQKHRKNQSELCKSENPKRKRQFEPIQIGKYKSKKQKQVGKYKSAKVSRENTSRIEQALETTNRETQGGKQQSRTYKSENTNRKNTNRGILIGTIQIR